MPGVETIPVPSNFLIETTDLGLVVSLQNLEKVKRQFYDKNRVVDGSTPFEFTLSSIAYNTGNLWDEGVTQDGRLVCLKGKMPPHLLKEGTQQNTRYCPQRHGVFMRLTETEEVAATSQPRQSTR